MPDYVALEALEDLGLGYPPADETDDLRPNKGTPPAHPTKNDAEGNTTTNQTGEQ